MQPGEREGETLIVYASLDQTADIFDSYISVYNNDPDHSDQIYKN